MFIRDADSPYVLRFQAGRAQLRIDLRPRAVHQHQAHAEAGEQVQVMRERDERAVSDDLAAEGDDKSAPAERVDIRRGGAEPAYEVGLVGGLHVGSRNRYFGCMRKAPSSRIISPFNISFWLRSHEKPGVVELNLVKQVSLYRDEIPVVISLILVAF
jgi:hypothetical protein